jgi:hypothetical protein
MRLVNTQQLKGPIISLAIHALYIYCLLKFVTLKTEEQVYELEIEVRDVEIKEIQEAVEPELLVADEDVPIDDFLTDVDFPAANEFIDDVAHEIDDVILESTDNFSGEEFLEIEPLASLFELPSHYSGRLQEKRNQVLKKYGASESSQTALLKALEWLKSVQEKNGSWAGNPAHTALGLLCFLAHGETPTSSEFGDTVQKAMHFLVKSMPSDGSICKNSTYAHGMVTYALSEAYAMTSVPMLVPAMNYGLQRIIDGQQVSGGFDYKYKKGKRWDLSIAGWQIQALKAGFAAGAEIPSLLTAMKKASEFVKTTYKNQKFGYSSPGSGKNMTGVGTLSLQLLGEGGSREVQGGCETILSRRMEKLGGILTEANWSKTAGKYLYGWYYDTQAMFHKGGSYWRKWNSIFQKVLTTFQEEDGHWEVGKASYGFKEDLSGKIYCTTLCCLQLEVYYRYLPTYKVVKTNFIRRAKLDITKDDDVGLIIE